MKKKQLTIDLSKEKFIFSELLNLNEIAAIRFDNYTDKIEIPPAINKYPNITELVFSTGSENLYQSPDNLEKCIHIKDITLFGYCDMDSLQPMPHLQELHAAVRNVENDTRQITVIFPNLKKLQIWGANLKNQKLPDEIENLQSLESLSLRLCGLENLPGSFANLKQLRELSLIHLPMDVFPEEITQLMNLEFLKIYQRLSKLPDSLSNLKKLRKLDLNSTLNGGNMDVASPYLKEKLYLKPIPEVIGKLVNLEDLDLGICAVYDITPLFPLKKLKNLNLQYSALKNCDGFSNLKMLEELNLDSSFNLKKLEGLKDLPLKKLHLSYNEMKSIKVLSSLTSLEKLNITGNSCIKDYSPVYNHNNIKELEADDKIIKNWKKRAEYKKLPSVSMIINELQTDAIFQFEQAVLHLSKHVKANYNDVNNPLASYFDVEIQDGETTFIEVLDSGIQKHIKNLSEETLVAIFGMTFKSVVYDNYNAALLVLNEIIARKNVAIQIRIITKFYKASKHYDAGHRYWGNTVHDQLIDNLLGQFTSETLYELFRKASIDMLNKEGGDAIDELFIPAFKNTKDKELQERILNVFFEYEDEARTYLGQDYFDALLEQIKSVALPELLQIIQNKNKVNEEEKKNIALFEILNEENLPSIIEMLGNKISDEWASRYLYNIVKASEKINLPEKSLEILLNYLIKKDETNYLPNLLISQYHQNSPDKIIVFLKQCLEKKQLKSVEAFNILKTIITELLGLNSSPDELRIYEEFIVNHCNVSFDQIYNIEISKLLSTYFNHSPYNSDKDINWTLEKIKIISPKMEGEIIYSDLSFRLYNFIDAEEYENLKAVFDVLYPKCKETREESFLYLNIIAAVKLNDESYFDLIYKEVLQIKKISKETLAYNLACAFAYFERKDEMLFYIKDSIRLGKIKQQFLDDSDFEKYWEDIDFLRVIEEK